ncbi:MAG: chlorophyll a/b-binding protein [Cyanobacteria bacterium J06635_10]
MAKLETRNKFNRNNNMETPTKTDLPPVAPAYNGKDRNSFLFGFTPQAELWNGRLAMIGFLAYLIWDLAGYSVVRDIFHFVGY